VKTAMGSIFLSGLSLAKVVFISSRVV
jgi:hypothetical protein